MHNINNVIQFQLLFIQLQAHDNTQDFQNETIESTPIC